MKKQLKFLLYLLGVNFTCVYVAAVTPSSTFTAELLNPTFTAYYPRSNKGTCIPNNEKTRGTCDCIQDPNTGYIWSANAYIISYGERNSLAGDLNNEHFCGLGTGWELPTSIQMQEVANNVYRMGSSLHSTLANLFNDHGFIGISDDESYWLQDYGLKWYSGGLVRLPIPNSENAERALNSNIGSALLVNTSSIRITDNYDKIID